eukprot:6186334-Pleurochrysis_carterae.AAC.4
MSLHPTDVLGQPLSWHGHGPRSRQSTGLKTGGGGGGGATLSNLLSSALSEAEAPGALTFLALSIKSCLLNGDGGDAVVLDIAGLSAVRFAMSVPAMRVSATRARGVGPGSVEVEASVSSASCWLSMASSEMPGSASSTNSCMPGHMTPVPRRMLLRELDLRATVPTAWLA